MTGKRIWGHNNKVAPLTMTADEHRVFFHDGEKVVALNRSSGDVAWSAGKSFLPETVRFNFGPKLVVHDGVVLYAGGDRLLKAIDSPKPASCCGRRRTRAAAINRLRICW